MDPVVKITWFDQSKKVLARVKCSNSEVVTDLFDSCDILGMPGIKVEVLKEGDDGDE